LNGKHEYPKAVEDFDRAIEMDPDNAMYHNNRGVAYLRQKKFDKAVEDFDKTLKIESKFSSGYHNRGMAYSGKGRHDKAIEEFSKVIEMNPSSPVLYKDRGTAYRKLGEYELALKDFEKAIELDKKFAPGYAALGLLRVLAPEPPIHNPVQGLRLAEKAVTLTNGASPDMLENLAEVQHALNHTDDALRTLQNALAMDPSNKDYQELLKKWTGVDTPPVLLTRPEKRYRFPNPW
jgi:tetratricopeptide (TPR) repeat protein